MKNTKRFVGVLLVISMILSCTPLTVFADTPIEFIAFSCNTDGKLNVSKPAEGFMYVYKTSDNGYDTLFTQTPFEKTVGSVKFTKTDYKVAADTLELNNKAFIELIKVSVNDWNTNTEITVIGYGCYALPLKNPTITVDALLNGQYTTVKSVTTAQGNYSGLLLNATFLGWFLDKEGTQPATTDTEAYAIVKLSAFGDILEGSLEETILTDGTNSYVASAINKKNASTMQIAFFAQSTANTVTISTNSKNAKVYLNGDLNLTSLKVEPDPWGEYPLVFFHILCDAGYYIKSIKINGQEKIDEFITKGTMYTLPETEPFEYFYRFTPNGNTNIIIETGLCDILVFDTTGINAPDDNPEPFNWHASKKYYVAEGYITALCQEGIFLSTIEGSIDHGVIDTALITDKNNGGIILNPYIDHLYAWHPIDDYNNGIQDTITVYPLLSCLAHDESELTLTKGTNATCQSTGTKEYYSCKYCRGLFVKKGNEFVRVFPDALSIPKTDHKYTAYTTHNDTHHTIKCAFCEATINELHKFVDNACACGAKNETYIKGDLNGDKKVTDADAIYLLYHTIFGDDYPINQSVDFNGDKKVTDADAIYLLYHTIFGDDYPLK